MVGESTLRPPRPGKTHVIDMDELVLKFQVFSIAYGDPGGIQLPAEIHQ